MIHPSEGFDTQKNIFLFIITVFLATQLLIKPHCIGQMFIYSFSHFNNSRCIKLPTVSLWEQTTVWNCFCLSGSFVVLCSAAHSPKMTDSALTFCWQCRSWSNLWSLFAHTTPIQKKRGCACKYRQSCTVIYFFSRHCKSVIPIQLLFHSNFNLAFTVMQPSGVSALHKIHVAQLLWNIPAVNREHWSSLTWWNMTAFKFMNMQLNSGTNRKNELWSAYKPQ